MFGRSRELAALSAAWSAARTGHGQVVLITGEAGIGKTRLVTELAPARRQRRSPRRRRRGRGRRRRGAPRDLAGARRALVDVVPVPPESVSWPAELGRLAPDLARALGRRAAPPVVAAPELERLRLFDAVLRLVEWAARGAAGAARGRGPAPRRPREPRALRPHRPAPRRPARPVRAHPARPAEPPGRRRAARRPRRTGLDVTELEIGPLGRPEVAEVARSVAALTDAFARPGRRRRRRQPAAGGRERPRDGRRQRRRPRRACARWSAPRSGHSRPRRASWPKPWRRPDGRSPRRRSPRSRPPPRPNARCSTPGWPAGCGAAWPTGTRCWPRRPAPTCATRSAPTWPSRSPSRRPPSTATRARPRSRGTCSGPAATTWPPPDGRAQRGTPARSARCPRPSRSGPRPCAAIPTTPRLRMELAEAYSWSGRTGDFEREWEAALAQAPRRGGSRSCGAAAGCCSRRSCATRRASLAAYRRAAELLGPDAPAALRARVLFGLAWNEASAGDPARSDAAARRGRGAVVPSRTTRRRPRSRRRG